MIKKTTITLKYQSHYVQDICIYSEDVYCRAHGKVSTSFAKLMGNQKGSSVRAVGILI